jgi:purine-cytosine permease-like protein
MAVTAPERSSGATPLSVSREDDPRVVEEAATEDYSLHVVPRSWRLERGKLTMAWYGVMTAFFYVYFAAFIALAYGTVNALIGIGLTIVAYTAVNAVLLRTASRSGLTVALFSRSIFGFAGAAIPTLILAATAIYYVVFEGAVVAVAAQSFFGGPLKLWYAIVVFSTAPLVWRGIRAKLDRINGFMLPFYAVAMVGVIVWALASDGYNGFLAGSSAAPGTTLPWLQAFVAHMGVWVLMLYTMDFARLSRPEDERYHRNVTFGWLYYVLTFGVNGLIGILLVSTFGITFAQLAGQESALPVRIVGLTGLLGLALIVITQMRINTVNLYVASTNLQSFFARLTGLTLPRTLWVIVACCLGYGLMLTNVFGYVNDALAYQGIAIVAWVGVALGHVWYLRRTHVRLEDVEFRPGRVPRINPAGVGAWGLATVVGLVLKLSDSTGSQTWELIGLPLTFGISFAAYAAATSVAKPSWFSMRRPHDPAAEVSDPWEDRVRCTDCDRSYLAREMDRRATAPHDPVCASCATTEGFHASARASAREHATAG